MRALLPLLSAAVAITVACASPRVDWTPSASDARLPVPTTARLTSTDRDGTSYYVAAAVAPADLANAYAAELPRRGWRIVENFTDMTGTGEAMLYGRHVRRVAVCTPGQSGTFSEVLIDENAQVGSLIVLVPHYRTAPCP